jgi:hypothetical protein
MTDQEMLLRNGLATSDGRAVQRDILLLSRVEPSKLKKQPTPVSHRVAGADEPIFRIEVLPDGEACYIGRADNQWYLHWEYKGHRIHLDNKFFPSSDAALDEFKLVRDLLNRVPLH